MKVTCPQCGKRYEIDPSRIGRRGKCVCGSKFVLKAHTEAPIPMAEVIEDGIPVNSSEIDGVIGRDSFIMPRTEAAGPDDLFIMDTPSIRFFAKTPSQNAKKSWLNMELALGWGINILSWILFLATGNHLIEFIMGVANLGAAYLGFRNRSSRLLYFSVGDAAWMFAWSFGLFGRSWGFLDLHRLINQIH